MVTIWTDHALERVAERAAHEPRFRELVELAIESRDWEVWHEHDTRPREGSSHARGWRENLLVHVGTSWAVVRFERRYLVVSVLTEEQYAFNTMRLWSRTPGAVAQGKGPLKHSPFASLNIPAKRTSEGT
jgi:hypothetical protein